MALKDLIKKWKAASLRGRQNTDKLNVDLAKKRSVGTGSFSERLGALFFQFGLWFQVRAQPMLRQFEWTLIRRCCFLIVLAFVLASSVSTFAANYALHLSAKVSSTKAEAAEEVAVSLPASKSDAPSAGEMRHGILARNIFNSSGELAPEPKSAGELAVTKTKDLDFDTVQCVEEKLPVEVLGTIFTGDPLKSIVSVKDPAIADTDAYKGGDLIIGHEDYEVSRVFRGKVEFRKGDTKICVYLKGFDEPKVAETNVGSNNPSPPKGAVKPENVESLTFDSAFVQQEIGPGYANILNSAKLIPEVEASGQIAGFKIIAIAAGSLFDKMKLQNGDVISEVNGVSLKDASQGFKLYQALQEEREITVNFLRSNEPMIRKVLVK